MVLYRIKRFFFKKILYCKWKIKFVFFNFYNPVFNKTVLQQNDDFKRIPIIIINFNQLHYLQKLVNHLINDGYKSIVIIDNKSTYPPLLEYYENINNCVDIILRKTNDGHRVFWKNKELFNKYGKGYYVITDADIEISEDCPHDFIKHFKKILDNNKKLIKVGFSLKIDDIPDCNEHKATILNWENQFWVNKDESENYIGLIDTTFALYRPINQFYIDNFYKAIRTRSPYTAKHGGWYIDHKNLSEEQTFYMKTAGKSGSWKVEKSGELSNKGYQ